MLSKNIREITFAELSGQSNLADNSLSILVFMSSSLFLLLLKFKILIASIISVNPEVKVTSEYANSIAVNVADPSPPYTHKTQLNQCLNKRL